jgi:hypothetical protein
MVTVVKKTYDGIFKIPASGVFKFPICGKNFNVYDLRFWDERLQSLCDFCIDNCDVGVDKCVLLGNYFEYWRISAGYEDKHHVAMPHALMFRLGHWRCP